MTPRASLFQRGVFVCSISSKPDRLREIFLRMKTNAYRQQHEDSWK